MGKRLDEIASRHYPVTYPEPVCAWCINEFWPCDAAVLLMHIARRARVQEPGTDTEGAALSLASHSGRPEPKRRVAP